MKNLITNITINKLLFVLLIIGFLLRLYEVNFQSAWLDEIHTLNEANPDFGFLEVYGEVFKGEQMPVLYFYIIHFLFKIFGYTVVVLRMFSVIIGTFSIFTTYLLGKELINKRVGIISALLATVNYFHIFYSQEGRPYIFLYLFTTLSFYYFVKFIKKPQLKNTIYFGLFTGLMLYGHFFAIFSIVSQYLFLFFLLFFIKKDQHKSLIKGGVISGIIIFIMHIPSIKILLNISNISSFWVKKPTIDVYTNMLKNFFGNAELLVFVMICLAVYYFVIIFSDKDETIQTENKSLIDNPLRFSFMLFVFWAVITLLLPLIRSHVKVPMIIDRYFITLLPLVLLLLSISIEKIRSQIIRGVILCLILIFSMIDLTIVKKYYSVYGKTQFREGVLLMQSEYPKDLIVTRIGEIYLKYYLANTDNKREIFSGSINDYISNLQTKNYKPNGFWYFDGHNPEYELNDESRKFLDTYYEIDVENFYFDALAKHYTLIGNNNKKSFSLDLKPFFDPSLLDPSGNISLYENGIISTNKQITLEKGKYSVKIRGRSYPDEPVDGKNAHVILRIDGVIIGSTYLTESVNGELYNFDFSVEEKKNSQITVEFDNDILKSGKDRNLSIFSINIKIIK